MITMGKSADHALFALRQDGLKPPDARGWIGISQGVSIHENTLAQKGLSEVKRLVKHVVEDCGISGNATDWHLKAAYADGESLGMKEHSLMQDDCPLLLDAIRSGLVDKILGASPDPLVALRVTAGNAKANLQELEDHHTQIQTQLKINREDAAEAINGFFDREGLDLCGRYKCCITFERGRTDAHHRLDGQK